MSWWFYEGTVSRSDHLYDMATYTANLCPIHRGGAASHSRQRTTILDSEGGDCKRLP